MDMIVSNNTHNKTVYHSGLEKAHKWQLTFENERANTLLRLERNGFTVNPLKCEWVTSSTEYLGFLLTPQGIKPLPNKIIAITSIARPSSIKKVRSFVGLVNHYKDMWPNRAHFLAPLTDICSTRLKFIWSHSQENAFQIIKKLVAEDVMIRFPDDSKPFSIYTDSRKFQLGTTIKQMISQ